MGDDLDSVRRLTEDRTQNHSNSRYQERELVGYGGMGYVYKVYDRKLERTVALKILQAKTAADAQGIHSFFKEAKATARLQHPNIVKIFDFGRDGADYYIAMEYIQGQNLEEFATSKPLSCTRSVKIVAKVARALHHAHKEGIIHRDIKPSNIMLRNDEPIVMDFGLAKLLDANTTSSGTITGTPHYMSPEQANGEQRQIDRRADVYGIGALLYRLLTGRPPFEGSSTIEIFTSIIEKKPIFPREFDPNIPREIEEICLKCLHKNPKMRYKTAIALAHDLELYLSARPIKALSSSSVYRMQKMVKRNVYFTLSAIMFVICLLAAGFIVVKNRMILQELDRLEKKLEDTHGIKK